MYRYDEFDHAFVAAARHPVPRPGRRRLSGELTEDEFKPLRLMNGLYLQLHAYMLRVAIPYGTLNAAADAQARAYRPTYDKGYGHFTTRQNIQFNWPRCRDVPDMLEELAEVEMHAIQTSATASATSPPTISPARRRRGRRSAPRCRNPAAMVDAASGILVPAAQVQDRRHRRAERPRRDPGPRHRPAAVRNAAANSASPSGRRRPRAHADDRRKVCATSCPKADLLPYRSDPARLQPARPPRQQVQGAHQDPGA
jgi:hypothetical protein